MRELFRSATFQLKGLAFLAVGIGVIIMPIVVYGMLTRPDPRNLFEILKGHRTSHGELIINPAQGTFAGLQLGMSMAAAEKKLPAGARCTSSPPNSLTYCDGDGLLVTITDGCYANAGYVFSCPAGTTIAPLAEIDVQATPGAIYNPGQAAAIRNTIPGSQQTVTTEGLHLGDSLSFLRTLYTLVSKEPFGPSSCPGFGTSWVALVGHNTAVFDVEGGAVAEISLFPGRESDICSFEGGKIAPLRRHS